MGAIIRQQYTDPVSKKKEVREIHIDVEIMRLDDSWDATSCIRLKAEPWGHDQFCDRVFTDPTDLVAELIDGKRTFKPANIHFTKLKEPYKSNQEFVVIDRSFGAFFQPGHPIAIMADFEGNKIQYSIVEDLSEDKLSIKNPFDADYSKGAIIQNLCNKWWKGPRALGCKSQLSKPNPPVFMVKEANNSIKIMISTPINLGSSKYYDVYVRDKEFSEVAPHWVPDLGDVPVKETTITATTYNGGSIAGGGKIENGKSYYITVLAKDDKGCININESGGNVDCVNV